MKQVSDSHLGFPTANAKHPASYRASLDVLSSQVHVQPWMNLRNKSQYRPGAALLRGMAPVCR